MDKVDSRGVEERLESEMLEVAVGVDIIPSVGRGHIQPDKPFETKFPCFRRFESSRNGDLGRPIGPRLTVHSPSFRQ